ncbi:MAG: diacylglycerol kinase [Cypionkella sp.]|nr:diacylglycerol kinase [Cypionkella sp.]
MRNWLSGEARRIGNTARWSYEGWVSAWAREKSLRQWTLVNVLSVALSLVVEMTTGERALIYALGILVLAAEMMNTAIEEVVDYISEEIDPRAKRAKDAGSAVVALVAIAGGVAWAVVLLG